MSSDVSNARGGKKAPRREKNGEESSEIPPALIPGFFELLVFARGFAARENSSRASPTRR